MRIIAKIISGGQTGVDRAALDAAMECRMDCGGWCPLGRLAEDGFLNHRYPLKETPTPEYAERTEWNVRDSDGTLILIHGALTGGTALTVRIAERLGRPCLTVELGEESGPGGALAWAEANRIRTLNVAGPRESTWPGIYEEALEFLRRFLLPRN